MVTAEIRDSDASTPFRNQQPHQQKRTDSSNGEGVGEPLKGSYWVAAVWEADTGRGSVIDSSNDTSGNSG